MLGVSHRDMIKEGTSAWYRAEAERLRVVAAKVRRADIQRELIKLAAQFDVLAPNSLVRLLLGMEGRSTYCSGRQTACCNPYVSSWDGAISDLLKSPGGHYRC